MAVLKKWINNVILIAFLVLCVGIVSAEYPSGLIRWYPGNGNFNDAQGGSSGNLMSGATYTHAIVDQGFYFDGVNDYGQLPHPGYLSQGSVAMWVNFTSISSYLGPNGHGLMVYTISGNPINQQFDGLDIGIHDSYGSNLGLFLYEWVQPPGHEVPDGDHPGTSHWADSGIQPQPGQWYHIVTTWGPGGMKIYINGVLRGSNPYTGGVPDWTHYSYLGSGTWGSYVNAKIDEVQIYNRALTATEVQELYLSYFQPPIIEIKDAKMVSPNELGIGAVISYPENVPAGLTTIVKLTGTVDDSPVSESIPIPMSSTPGGTWGTSETIDVENKVLPTTPLKINLENQGVTRFTDDVEFSLTGTASYEGSPESEPYPFSGKIVLPVVVLHGYVATWDISTLTVANIKGFPAGNTFAPSAEKPYNNPKGRIANLLRASYYIGAYEGLSMFLTEKGYNKQKYWYSTYTPRPAGSNYVTLWDPEENDIGYSSLSYATASDLDMDRRRVTKLVHDFSYADKFNIIAHSTGGLVARFWASRDPSSFNKIITVGTPHEGIARFYIEALGGHYESRDDYIKQELTLPGKKSNLITWFVPKWIAIDYYTCEECSPSDIEFTNSFNYGYTSSEQTPIKYYLLYTKNFPTNYTVSIQRNENLIWYSITQVNQDLGDGYVYWRSARGDYGPIADYITREEVDTATEKHAFLLTDSEVHKKIWYYLNQ